MIRHTVHFKFKDEHEGESKIKMMETAKSRLLSLTSIIPEIKSLQIGFNLSQNERSYDMCLVGDFEDMDAVERYMTHPDHLKVAEYIIPRRVHSSLVDFEL